MDDIEEHRCTKHIYTIKKCHKIDNIEERRCNGHIFTGQKCQKIVSLTKLYQGYSTCKDCYTIIQLQSENDLKLTKQCGYVYENGTVCCETNLTYHGHCHRLSCDGCKLVDAQCPICKQP